MHSPRWRSPSRAITSSSRSLTQPIARGSSPSRSPSDCATTPTPSTRSRSATPNDAHRHGNGIRNIKASQENPSKLGFYPPAWQAFLQEAKLDARLQAVLNHPVPEHQMALNLAREVLDSVLWRYHEEDIKLEKGECSSHFPRLFFIYFTRLFPGVQQTDVPAGRFVIMSTMNALTDVLISSATICSRSAQS